MNKIILEKAVSEFTGAEIQDDIPSSFKCAGSAAEVSDFLWLRRYWDDNSAPVEKCIATVWIKGDSLNVFALMEDSDVFSDAAGKNDRTWIKGDVMEFFLRPDRCRNYFELHLAPNLATLELSIPDIESFSSGKCVFENMFFDSGMSCETGLFNKKGVKGWWGLMKIPAGRIGLGLQNETLGEFCICRYNYTRKKGTTVEHSASAALPKSNFHDPDNWQKLVS